MTSEKFCLPPCKYFGCRYFVPYSFLLRPCSLLNERVTEAALRLQEVFSINFLYSSEVPALLFRSFRSPMMVALLVGRSVGGMIRSDYHSLSQTFPRFVFFTPPRVFSVLFQLFRHGSFPDFLPPASPGIVSSGDLFLFCCHFVGQSALTFPPMLNGIFPCVRHFFRRFVYPF